jgi:class 3 adenylate cyclase
MAEGFRSVCVLAGGLAAWVDSDLPLVDVDPSTESVLRPENGSLDRAETHAVAHPKAFVPGLVENYAARSDLPLRHELTVLFADIADSTPLVADGGAEHALAVVQGFMQIVTESALAWCGDVKDYEGDGALMYFETVSEAVQAAFAIRTRLAGAGGPLAGIRGRLSLDVGDIVVGIVGSPMRRSVALIGPCINRAARLLKEIPPEGIIATEQVVVRLQAEVPGLAARFQPLAAPLELKGFGREVVSAYWAPP